MIQTIQMNIKKYIVFSIFTLSLSTSYAQIGEQRHNFAFGVNGGMTFSKVNFNPTIRQNSLSGITGGVTARYISERYFKMICGAQLEVNFSQYGWSEYYEDYPDLKYSRKMNYVEIPFLAHLAFGKERGMQIFIHAGPQIAFFLNDKKTQSGDWDGNNNNITAKQHDMDIQNKFDYGITGGLGMELRTKAGNFLVEGRYYYALSDFYKTTKRDYFSRAANGVITAKVTYLFDLKK